MCRLRLANSNTTAQLAWFMHTDFKLSVACAARATAALAEES